MRTYVLSRAYVVVCQGMSLGELYDDSRTTSGVVPEIALGELVEFEGNYDYQPSAARSGGASAQGECPAAQGEGETSQERGEASGDGTIKYVTYEAEDGSTVTIPATMLNIYDADQTRSRCRGRLREAATRWAFSGAKGSTSSARRSST